MKEINDIFVFGSNLGGRHGKGAALTARRDYGAIYGQPEGLQGQSYAIPTKDENLVSLPISRIAEGIERFKQFARRNPTYHFNVTPVGCGLAGYRREEILPLFLLGGLPENAHLLDSWYE